MQVKIIERLMKKHSVMFFAVILALITHTTHSWAQGACMVSDFDGQVLLIRDKDQPRPVNKFKKLWPGDQLELPQEAKVQLNYLGLGKIEQWIGPMRLTIEKSGAHGNSNVNQPKIIKIESITPYLKDSKILNQQNVSGQIAVRGGWFSQVTNLPLDKQKKKSLERLQITYGELKNKTNPSDSTADMYYLAGLEMLGQKETMAEHIQKLLSTNGYNPDLEAMLDTL